DREHDPKAGGVEGAREHHQREAEDPQRPRRRADRLSRRQGGKARERHHRSVSVRDVRDLVGEDRLDLLRLEPLDEAARDGHGRAYWVPSGGERIWELALDDRRARL